MFEKNFSTIEQKSDSIAESGEKEKTYAEMSEDERKEFKEGKEREFANLKASFERYGAESADIKIEEREGELKLIIKQENGEGLRGIGYDGKKFWMRLNQEREIEEKGESVKNNVSNEFQYNENTLASLESNFHGVKFEKISEGKVKVQIDPDHPAISITEFLGDKEIQLRGEYNGWGDVDPFEFNEETGKWESVLNWNGGKKECKIMIRDTEERESKKVAKPVKIKWNGKYGKGANQEMEIIL